MAEQGDEDPNQREAAYHAGAALLGDWALQEDIRPKDAVSVAVLDGSLDTLLALNGKSRRKLVQAISVIAAHDDHLAVQERELIRATCATLDCPLPPLLFGEA